MLTGEKLAMKREVFAKNAHFIGRVPEAKVEDFELSMDGCWQGCGATGKKEPCPFRGVSKSEHGSRLLGKITSINRVSSAGFVPRIVVIPTP